MSNPQIMEEEPITQSELKDKLQSIQKRDGELNFRAGKTLDHLNHVPAHDKKTRGALVKAIEGLEIPRLKGTHVRKIVDLMPANQKELNVILSGYTLTVTKANQEKIIESLVV